MAVDTGSNTNPPQINKTNQVGGLTFSVYPEQPKVNQPTQIGILYKKEFRPSVGSKEENELIKAITTKQGESFKVINSSLKDPNSVKINLSLRQHLNHTEAIWKSTNLLNPCHILYPINDLAKLKNYRHITSSQVAASCKYYAKYVQLPIASNQEENFSRELEWSYSYYFRKNTELRLYKTVQKDFALYEPLKQGGPLFLNKVALVDTVKNYNIQQNSDKDILEEHEFPNDYLQSLTKVFQTTTLWKTIIESNSMGSASDMENTSAYCGLVFVMFDDNKIRIVFLLTMAANRSADKTNIKNPNNKCWNGRKEGYKVTICPKPKDQARIKANQELFYKGNPPPRPPHKKWEWRPPDSGEGPKPFIYGKPYTWNDSTHCWEKDGTPPSGLTAQQYE
eukprot:jgi/Psemu1/8184/gm1.8184_g